MLDAELTGCGTFSSSKVGLIPEVTGVPLAESTVYFDPDSQEGSIFLINKSLDENMEFSIQLPFENARLTGAQELWNINPMAENNFYNQSAVTLNDCGSCGPGNQRIRRGSSAPSPSRFPGEDRLYHKGEGA